MFMSWCAFIASSDILKSSGPPEERERSRSRSATREHLKGPVYERSKSRRDIEMGVCITNPSGLCTTWFSTATYSRLCIWRDSHNWVKPIKIKIWIHRILRAELPTFGIIIPSFPFSNLVLPMRCWTAVAPLRKEEGSFIPCWIASGGGRRNGPAFRPPIKSWGARVIMHMLLAPTAGKENIKRRRSLWRMRRCSR